VDPEGVEAITGARSARRREESDASPVQHVVHADLAERRAGIIRYLPGVLGEHLEHAVVADVDVANGDFSQQTNVGPSELGFRGCVQLGQGVVLGEI